MLSFVAEEHNKPRGRQYVQKQLVNNKLDILFIEYPYTTALMDVFGASVRKDIDTVRQNLAGYFNDLNPKDADPNIKELAILALSKGVKVYPIDMTVKEVDTAYEVLPRFTHPLSKIEWLQDKSYVQPFQDEKLALRNEHMAREIAKYMPQDSTGGRALFLCGSSHFKPSVKMAEIEKLGWPSISPFGVDQIVNQLRSDITQITHFHPSLSIRERRNLDNENAQMLCFEIVCAATLAAKNKNGTKCLIEFIKAYPSLVSRVLGVHPEYCLDGKIEKTCIDAFTLEKFEFLKPEIGCIDIALNGATEAEEFKEE